MYSFKNISSKRKKAFSWYRNYSFALNHSNADLVYISLPNAFHYYWAKKALNKNYHVIVDKPISENYLQAKRIKFKTATVSEHEIFWDFSGDYTEVYNLRSLISH